MRIIHPKFQGMVILYGLSIGLCGLVLNFFVNRYFFARSTSALIESGMPADHPVFFFLAEQRAVMTGFFFVLSVMAVLISIFLGLLLSDRVASPLDQMKKHFDEVAKGRLPTRLHFRKIDFFQEVADAYNQELETLGVVPRLQDEPENPDKAR